MLFSFSFLFLLTLLSFEDTWKKKPFRFLWPFIFLFVSYGVATKIDEDEYRKFYYMIVERDSLGREYFWEFLYEKGWTFALYTKLCNLMNTGSYIYLIFLTFITILIQKFFFYKYSLFPCLALFLYFSHAFIIRDSITVRTGLASSLILVLISSVADKKLFKFYIYLFIATGIHYASVLGIVITFFKRLYSFLTYITFIAASLLLSFFQIPKYILNFIADRFEIVKLYLNSEYTYQISFLHPKLFQQFVIILLIIFLVKKFRKEISDNKILTLSINSYFFSTILFLAFKDFGIFAFRSATIFSVVEPLVIIFITTKLFKANSAWLICLSISIAIFIINYIVLEKNTIFI